MHKYSQRRGVFNCRTDHRPNSVVGRLCTTAVQEPATTSCGRFISPLGEGHAARMPALPVRPAPQSLIASQQISVVIDHAAMPRLPSTAACSDNGLAGRVPLVRRSLCCQFAVVPEIMTDILPLYGKHARIALYSFAVVFRLRQSLTTLGRTR
jgi:hypothetical protein